MALGRECLEGVAVLGESKSAAVMGASWGRWRRPFSRASWSCPGEKKQKCDTLEAEKA